MSLSLPGFTRALPPGAVAAGVRLLTSTLAAYAPTFPTLFLPRRTQKPTPVYPPLAGPLTYVALCASDGEGWGANHPGEEGWVPLFAGCLPQPARLVNLGIGGITLPRAVQLTLPRAVQAQPDLVTIWLVVNDVIKGVSLNQYRAALDRLLSTLRMETKARIAIGNLPNPPERLSGHAIPPVVRQLVAGAWNGTIADLAGKYGAVLVDLYRDWPVARYPDYLCSDGLHPSTAGYRALASVFHTTLREHRVV
jgi:acyl-CoA thioesterase I